MKIERTSEPVYNWTHDGLNVSKTDCDLMDALVIAIGSTDNLLALDYIIQCAEDYALDQEMDLNRYNWFLDHITKVYKEQKSKYGL